MVRVYNTGEKLTGKVTGIQPYGAFIALDEETQGLVHISEITYGYVKDIEDYLAVGDEVDVVVLDVNEAEDKISLSIRALQDPPERSTPKGRQSLQAHVKKHDAEGFNSLKEKLEEWIEQSRK